MASKWSEKYRWHDGKRVLKWKGQASHYNSGQKRKYPPLNEETAKFGFEVRRERVRQFKSQPQLAKELGILGEVLDPKSGDGTGSEQSSQPSHVRAPAHLGRDSQTSLLEREVRQRRSNV